MKKLMLQHVGIEDKFHWPGSRRWISTINCQEVDQFYHRKHREANGVLPVHGDKLYKQLRQALYNMKYVYITTTDYEDQCTYYVEVNYIKYYIIQMYSRKENYSDLNLRKQTNNKNQYYMPHLRHKKFRPDCVFPCIISLFNFIFNSMYLYILYLIWRQLSHVLYANSRSTRKRKNIQICDLNF